MANMMRMDNRYYEYEESSNEVLKNEVTQLRNELSELKREMVFFREFMKTKGSFIDFKVFKFNQDEEIRKQEEIDRRRTQSTINPFYALRSIR